jgi:hypothetical protein
MSREQIRSLPVEAQNVVHLLSLQPGAIFIPTSNPATVDPRYGSVAGARADQQSVTLDGIDVNDPQMATAYTSAIRMTRKRCRNSASARRTTTPKWDARADRRSRSITRSGTNQFDGSGIGPSAAPRRRANEYFLRVVAECGGPTEQAAKLDKDIFGGRLGGPIQRNKLFFFANVEALKRRAKRPCPQRPVELRCATAC